MTRASIRIAGLLMAVALVAAACGDDDGGFGITTEPDATTATTATTEAETTTTTGAATTLPAGERYSEEIRSGYLSGCTQEAPVAACECTLREFERRYTEDEFVEIAIANQDAGGDLPPELLEVVALCSDEVDDTRPTTTTAPTAEGYPEAFRDGYLEGCSADGSPAFCECTLDRFEDLYPLETFIELFVDADAGTPLPPEAEAVIAECAPLLEG